MPNLHNLGDKPLLGCSEGDPRAGVVASEADYAYTTNECSVRPMHVRPHSEKPDLGQDLSTSNLARATPLAFLMEFSGHAAYPPPS